MGTRAAIGITVKSGWASAVLLAGPATAPRVLDSVRLELSDPAIPESRQPYHAGLGTARRPGPALSRLVASVERFGQRSVAGLVRRYRADGHALAGAGVVVGSLIDPERIGNAHSARGSALPNGRRARREPLQAPVLDLARAGSPRGGGRGAERARE